MSLAYFIVAEREIEGFDISVNGKAIAHTKGLKKVCRELGVKPLEDFISQDPDELAEFIEDEGEDAPDDLPALQWYEAKEGLLTVRALITHLATNPKAIKKSDAVLDDLRDYERVLVRLEADNVRWYLSVDF